MANNYGTIVQSTVRPPSTDDKFPVVFGNEILGGAKQGITLADLNAIPSERLSVNTIGVTSENIYVWTGSEWIPLFKQINAQNIFGTGNISTSRDGVEVYVEDYAGDTFEEKLNTAITAVNFGTTINCSNYTGNQIKTRDLLNSLIYSVERLSGGSSGGANIIPVDVYPVGDGLGGLTAGYLKTLHSTSDTVGCIAFGRDALRLKTNYNTNDIAIGNSTLHKILSTMGANIAAGIIKIVIPAT